jgi:hypothetical protein
MFIYGKKIRNKYIEISLLICFVSILYLTFVDRQYLNMVGRDIGGVIRMRIVNKFPKLKNYMNISSNNYIIIKIPFPTFQFKDGKPFPTTELKDGDINKLNENFQNKIALQNYSDVISDVLTLLKDTSNIKSNNYLNIGNSNFKITSDYVDYNNILSNNKKNTDNILTSMEIISMTYFFNKLTRADITIFITV